MKRGFILHLGLGAREAVRPSCLAGASFPQRTSCSRGCVLGPPGHGGRAGCARGTPFPGAETKPRVEAGSTSAVKLYFVIRTHLQALEPKPEAYPIRDSGRQLGNTALEPDSRVSVTAVASGGGRRHRGIRSLYFPPHFHTFETFHNKNFVLLSPIQLKLKFNLTFNPKIFSLSSPSVTRSGGLRSGTGTRVSLLAPRGRRRGLGDE